MEPGILALLALMILTLAWAVLEIRALRASVDPIASSPVARAIAGIGT